MAAVEWYAEEFAQHLEETYGVKIKNLTLLYKAKQMEKEQREEDFIEGYKKRAELSGLIFDESSQLCAKTLFKETFKSA
jgi:hypothetical protein